MNKIANRAWAAMILAATLFLGLCIIVVRYVRDSEEWYLHHSNSAVYTNGRLNSGKVYDRSGNLLVDASDGRVYPEDETLRRATLHLLGDVEGNVPDYMMDHFSNELTAYDLFNGAQSGQGVFMELTVNSQIQKTAYQALAGRKGTVGVYNYKTGEILCMVSTPGFDPMNPTEVDDSEAYEGAYVNRFLHASYTPGSVFKVVTASAAIAEIPDLQERVFHCDGDWVIDGVVVTCSGIHNDIQFDTALTKSCNVVFAQLAVELGAETLKAYAEAAGLTKALEFDGFVTAKGDIDLDRVSVNALAWAGVGQHTNQINPCQYMTFMGAIANGGVSAKPYVVSRIRCGPEETYRAAPTFNDPMLKQEIADRLAQSMHLAVVNNYGESNFAGLYAGAKSGTAERGGDLIPNALFAGFVQDETYPLAFVVVVEGAGSGSQTCVPIVNQVLNSCVTVLRMEKTS
ncbi:MAG: penicillin-binding protein [Oscillospiraceae bacterium]|nr:penicillin-binding protein [Oscillospiraceae bacterium]